MYKRQSFGGLADEYFYDNDVMKDTYPLDVEPWEQNISTRIDFISKWEDMLAQGTPVPVSYTHLYRLAEQALASGQQLPENFFKEAAATDIRSKGINNIFVGIGLFIFLCAITGEFGLGCIGLLVMFTGFGQLVIFYSQQKKNEEK